MSGPAHLLSRNAFMCAVVVVGCVAAPLPVAAQTVQTVQTSEGRSPPAESADDVSRAPTASPPDDQPATPSAPASPPAGEIAVPDLDDELLDLIGAPADDTIDANTDAGGARLPFGWELFGAGGIRLELKDPTFDTGPDAQAGVILFGRVGIRAQLGRHSAVIAIGDGAAFGNAWRNYPGAALALLNQAALTLRVPVLGRDAEVTFGRQEVALADGRLFSNPGFHARGNFARDGVLMSAAFPYVTVRSGAFYLGPYTPGDTKALTGAAFVDGTGRYDFTTRIAASATGYFLLHQDGGPALVDLSPVTAATIGARTRGDLYFITAKLGADVQVATHADAPLTVPGYGAHVEAGIRATPDFHLAGYRVTPIVGAEIEGTFGIPVTGTAFRTPAPALHGFLGPMDLVLMDNTLSGMVEVGARAEDALSLVFALRSVGLADPSGTLRQPGGVALLARDPTRESRLAFFEGDAVLSLNATKHITIDGMYGVAVFAGALAGRPTEQRLFLRARFTFDMAN